MGYYLLKWKSNWADEMDVDALLVLNEKEFNEWQHRKERLVELEDNGTKIDACAPIGSNEDIEYDTVREFYDEIQVTPITEDEYKVLKKLNLLKFGFDDIINDTPEWWLDDLDLDDESE